MSVEQMRLSLSGGEYQQWGVYFAVKAQKIELAEKVAASRRGRA